jgi:hypothetical protein
MIISVHNPRIGGVETPGGGKHLRPTGLTLGALGKLALVWLQMQMRLEK